MKLFYSPGACSLASHIVLEESGAKFETVKVNLKEGEQRKPEYLKINPKGKVPALVLDDGQVITENPAIMGHIANTHTQSGLLPPVGDIARTRAIEWLAWCSSGVHPMFGLIFAAARFMEGEEAQKKLAEKGRELAQKQLDLFDQGLQGKAYVLGERPSIADAYTPVFWHWAKHLELSPGPSHKASVEKLLTRPAVQRALTAEGLELRL